MTTPARAYTLKSELRALNDLVVRVQVCPWHAARAQGPQPGRLLPLGDHAVGRLCTAPAHQATVRDVGELGAACRQKSGRLQPEHASRLSFYVAPTAVTRFGATA